MLAAVRRTKLSRHELLMRGIIRMKRGHVEVVVALDGNLIFFKYKGEEARNMCMSVELKEREIEREWSWKKCRDSWRKGRSFYGSSNLVF